MGSCRANLRGRELVGAQDKFEAAIGLHRAGELERAQRIYRAVLQSTPTHFGAAHMLGALLLQRGDYDQAERQIRRALQIDPNVAEAHNNLGTALRDLGGLTKRLPLTIARSRSSPITPKPYAIVEMRYVSSRDRTSAREL